MKYKINFCETGDAWKDSVLKLCSDKADAINEDKFTDELNKIMVEDAVSQHNQQKIIYYESEYNVTCMAQMRRLVNMSAHVATGLNFDTVADMILSMTCRETLLMLTKWLSRYNPTTSDDIYFVVAKGTNCDKLTCYSNYDLSFNVDGMSIECVDINKLWKDILHVVNINGTFYLDPGTDMLHKTAVYMHPIAIFKVDLLQNGDDNMIVYNQCNIINKQMSMVEYITIGATMCGDGFKVQCINQSQPVQIKITNPTISNNSIIAETNVPRCDEIELPEGYTIDTIDITEIRETAYTKGIPFNITKLNGKIKLTYTPTSALVQIRIFLMKQANELISHNIPVIVKSSTLTSFDITLNPIIFDCVTAKLDTERVFVYTGTYDPDKDLYTWTPVKIVNIKLDERPTDIFTCGNYTMDSEYVVKITIKHRNNPTRQNLYKIVFDEKAVIVSRDSQDCPNDIQCVTNKYEDAFLYVLGDGEYYPKHLCDLLKYNKPSVKKYPVIKEFNITNSKMTENHTDRIVSIFVPFEENVMKGRQTYRLSDIHHDRIHVFVTTKHTLTNNNPYYTYKSIKIHSTVLNNDGIVINMNTSTAGISKIFVVYIGRATHTLILPASIFVNEQQMLSIDGDTGKVIDLESELSRNTELSEVILADHLIKATISSITPTTLSVILYFNLPSNFNLVVDGITSSLIFIRDISNGIPRDWERLCNCSNLMFDKFVDDTVANINKDTYILSFDFYNPNPLFTPQMYTNGEIEMKIVLRTGDVHVFNVNGGIRKKLISQELTFSGK